MDKLLRKLARSHQWQSLYVRCKDLGTLRLFGNDYDLSEIQRRFLMWLEIYNSLYMDLRMEEDFISEAVIEDDIRCYDDQTEILTDKGWKYFKDLDKTEKVATLNPKTNYLEYQRPIRYIKYWYKGKMLKLKTKRFDLLVTPNHQHFQAKYDNHKNKIIWIFENSLKISKRFWLIFKRIGKWKGRNKKYFMLEGINKEVKVPNRWYKNLWFGSIKKTKAIKIDIKSWLEFLGWYLSEGNCYSPSKGNYRIRIAQTNESKKVILKQVLDKLPWKFNYYVNEFCITSKQLYTYLKQFGKTKDKFVPNFIKSLTPELIKIFLNSYKLGDGHQCSQTRFWISTSSKKMRDDLMEIGLKAEYAVTYNKHNKKKNWNVNFLKEKKGHSKFINRTKWIDYEDYVYDVEVSKYHTLFIRRNGKTVWSGNCEAYLLYKSKKRNKKGEKKSNRRIDNTHGIPSVIFKDGKK